ncbi:MAG: GIY-YIG nuclease family protein [Patescibacteria group bacterium]
MRAPSGIVSRHRRTRMVGQRPLAENPTDTLMYYVYILQSLTHATRYIGSTQDVQNRLKEHNAGKCRYTSGRRPWRIIRTEEYTTRSEAMQREKFLKSGKGREFLDSLLSKHQSGIV